MVTKHINGPWSVAVFGGPGTGKSSIMAGVFSYLKFHGVNCEMAPEFAKEKVWEGSLKVLNNQIYVFAKQHHTIARLLGQVDLIITDSPLLLSLHYGKNVSESFKNVVLEEHGKMRTFNVFLVRKKKYNPKGRTQTFRQAVEIDVSLSDILKDNGVQYKTLDAIPENVSVIGDMCLKILKEKK